MGKKVGSKVTVQDIVADILKTDPAYMYASTVDDRMRMQLRIDRIENICLKLAEQIDDLRAEKQNI